MNKQLLLGKMVAAGYTQTSTASAIGVAVNTLSNKINGKVPFNVDEIYALCDLWGITDDGEKVKIFLTKPSQKRDTQAG